MCGLWGFVSHGGRADPALLGACQAAAADRGPDGWGCAWSAPGGALEFASGDGHPGAVPRSSPAAVAVIGHCRLATAGARSVRQPLPSGPGYLAHNGTVANAEALSRRYGYRLRTDCDSEALAQAVGAKGGDLGRRLRHVLGRTMPPAPHAVLALYPRRFAALAIGQPLFRYKEAAGAYYASKATGPVSEPCPDGEIETWPIVPAPAPRGRPRKAQAVGTPAACRGQPLAAVEWIERTRLRPNGYNPNAVPPPEMDLLRISLLEDGWTQPIVGDRRTGLIIDGEHRWTVAGEPAIAALTGGLVPVVWLDRTEPERIASTVRHNRARGEHGVLPMAVLVRRLLASGLDKGEVGFRLGMEPEEVSRLADAAGMPEILSRNHQTFNEGWQPG